VAPGGAAGAAPAKFRPGPAAGPVGEGRGRRRGALGPTWRVEPGGEAVDGGHRRCTRMAAAVELAPVR
jgi:hypothetical protein